MARLKAQPSGTTPVVSSESNQWPPLELPPPKLLFDKHEVLGPEHIEAINGWYMNLQNTLDVHQRNVGKTITDLQKTVADQQKQIGALTPKKA